jgi:hypothetical protein
MAMERRHVGALTREVLRDPALCFELLRQAHSSCVRSVQQPGSGAAMAPPSALKEDDEPAVFGMDEAAAAQTVLGLDLSALSTHVVKQWGLEPRCRS